MPRLALYYYPSCYFCGMVLRALQHFGLEAELRNIHEELQWQAELMQVRGRQTVPVLRIEEEGKEVQWMGESRDIVQFLSLLPTE